MKKLNPMVRRKSLALAIAALSTATAYSSAVYAQDGATELEEITVTGSRIRMTDGMAAPTPVTAITPAALTDFEPGGTVAEQLDALPQFFSTQSAQRGGGALFGSAGGSYLNMRGLGAQRTLVLFDGSRVAPADKRGTVNVDMFPTALVRTVDVVTGGASAAYGADALGGVTNFVVDREFQGLKVDVGTGVNEWGDGQKWNFGVAGGVQIGDNLNLIGSIEAKQIDQIARDPGDLDSDWWQRWGYVNNTSGSGPTRLTVPWVSSIDHSPTGLITAPGFSMNGLQFTEDGRGVQAFPVSDISSGVSHSQSGGPMGGIHNDVHNGGPSGAEVIGRSAFLGAKYTFTDSFEGFAQIMAGRSESNQKAIRGSYSTQGPWVATIFSGNPFLPPAVQAAMDAEGIESFGLQKVGSRIGELNPGLDTEDRNVFTSYSWQVGFDWNITNNWDLRASWQSGESDKRSGSYNHIRSDRMFLALDAVIDPATGGAVCNVTLRNPSVAELAAAPEIQGKVSSRDPNLPLASPIGLDNSVQDCVPWNHFGSGNASQAAVDYIGTDKIGVSFVEQDFAEALLTGDIWEGWGYGPVSMAAGLTWREQSFTDGAVPTDVDVLGPPINAPALGIRGIPRGYYGGSPNLHQFSTVPLISGSYDVWEWFTEVQATVWEADSGAQRLGASAAFRQSDYSTTGSIDSWKIGMDFQLFEDLRFRATKSRDVREANFSERFDAQGGGGSVDDPEFGGENYQITTVSGGNPNLSPETADTTVIGLVYQPSWLDGFQLSTDWYEIKIDGAVASLGQQRIVEDCFSGADPAQCALIERDSVTNRVLRVFNVNQNLNKALTEGVDLEVSYRAEPNFFGDSSESLSIRALAGWLLEDSDTTFTGATTNAEGGYNRPDLTANITVNYDIGDFGISLQQRYIPETIRDTRWVEGVDVDINTVDASTWTNMRLTYRMEMGNGSNLNLNFNVQNLFDENPPIIASFSSRGGSQTTSANYDTFGRRYALSANYSF
ncbi:TonB-dependent receptor [Gammaproteobacteria bacterium]|nr:TonB-dependent receptor [Gammaproteobacteria bacterium]